MRSSFSDLRDENRQLRETIFKKVRNQIVKNLSTYSILYVSCFIMGKGAYEANNQYSIKHLEYNLSICWIYMRFYFLMLLGLYTFNNFGIRSRVVCFNYLLIVTLSFLRMLMAVYIILFIFVDFFNVLLVTWNLNKDNTWKSKDEPFITNCSVWNAFICWIFWFAYTMVLWVVVFLLPAIALCFTI